MLTDEQLQEMVQVIVSEVDPEMIILFGSYANGSPKEDSDVDLIVIESDPFTPERSQISEEVRLWEALSRFRIPKDILVYCRDDVEYWKDSLNNILAQALRNGNILYQRRQASQIASQAGRARISDLKSNDRK